jgi:hypothetical protein
MIKPTIGRVVIVQRGSHDAQPDGWPAFVNKVHSNRCINVAGWNEWGTTVSFNSVPLLQDDDPAPATGVYAEWMPMQDEDYEPTAEEMSDIEASAKRHMSFVRGLMRGLDSNREQTARRP